MKCPVCKLSTGHYYWPNIIPGEPDQRFDYPLYQRGYPKGEQEAHNIVIKRSYKDGPEYISPRCSKCFDQVVNREKR